MKLSKKALALMLAMMLVFGGVVGGTVAWLTATSDTVTNTFTVGDINIELKEHDYIQSSNSLDENKEVTSESDYKMVPGNTLPKDPFVRVKANSEACWLFVKVEESTNLDTFISYEVDTQDNDDGRGAWTKLEGQTNIYYRSVTADEAKSGKEFYILGADTTNTSAKWSDNQVWVKDTVTKANMESVDGMNSDGTANNAEIKPTLNFTAAAVQSANVSTVSDAWAKLPSTFTGVTSSTT